MGTSVASEAAGTGRALVFGRQIMPGTVWVFVMLEKQWCPMHGGVCEEEQARGLGRR